VKQFVSITLFFCRTTLFSFWVNPILVVIGPFLFLFYATKDLNKHAALFLMLVVCFTFLFTKPFLYDTETQRDRSLNLGLFFTLVPLSPRRLYSSIILTFFLYSVVAQVVLFFLLYRLSLFPSLDSFQIVYDPVTKIGIYSGTYIDSRGFTQKAWDYIYPSVVFGIVRDRSGWPVFTGFYFLTPLFLIVYTTYLLVNKKVIKNVSLITLPFDILSHSFFITVAALFFCDIFLTPSQIYHLRTALDSGNIFMRNSLTLLFMSGLIATSLSLSLSLASSEQFSRKAT
jgi:hypothetical protein